MANVTVWLRAPKTYVSTDQEIKVRLGRTPSIASEFADRGDARSWAGQYADAMQDLDRAVQLKPGDAEELNARCFIRALSGQQLDQALADCNSALDINPQSAMTLDSRGFVYFRLGQLDKALTDLNAALKLEPKQAPSIYVRGLIERRAGDLAKGAADIAAAKAIDPSVSRIYDHYGVVR